jgi:hypothetical protein
MSAEHEPLTPFEASARTVLEYGVQSVDARTRSRLNQARQAALAAAAAPRPVWWRSLTLMPAAGAAAAAVLVAVTLWHPEPATDLPVLDAQRSAVEDMDLLADSEGLDLVQQGDNSFYEWAAEQADANGESSG